MEGRGGEQPGGQREEEEEMRSGMETKRNASSDFVNCVSFVNNEVFVEFTNCFIAKEHCGQNVIFSEFRCFLLLSHSSKRKQSDKVRIKRLIMELQSVFPHMAPILFHNLSINCDRFD